MNGKTPKSNPPNDSGNHLSPVESIGGIEIHWAASLLPMLNDEAFPELVEDIRANGLQSTIKLVGETRETAVLIDGRNRLRALVELGLDPYDFADVIAPEDLGDPVQYVLSLNLHRRHLTDSQRAMVANKAATLRKGNCSNASIEAATQADAAQTMKVSRASVQRAKVVTDRAVPEIVQAVERGDVSVSAAAAVADLPADEQRQLVKAGPKAIKQAAASKRATKSEPVATVSPATDPALVELRELYDAMEKPDELAVRQFCLWMQCHFSDLQTLQAGCCAWMGWGAE